MNEPCASFVLISNTPIKPAASSAETSSTKGARGGAFRGRTTRSVDGQRTGAVAGEAVADALAAGAMSSPSMAASGAVTSVKGSALTRPA
jgi:hypothetical protein